MRCMSNCWTAALALPQTARTFCGDLWRMGCPCTLHTLRMPPLPHAHPLPAARRAQDQSPPVTVATFVSSYFGYKSSFMGPLVAILFAFLAAFFCISTAALKYVKWQNR